MACADFFTTRAFFAARDAAFFRGGLPATAVFARTRVPPADFTAGVAARVIGIGQTSQ